MSMASPDPTPLEAKYPQTAQLCFSSHRRGGDGTGTDGVGGITICPEGYNFCIKEVIEDATEGECGKYKHNKVSGMGWDGMGLDGMGWDGMGREVELPEG